MTKYLCEHCGAEVGPDARYCGTCGGGGVTTVGTRGAANDPQEPDTTSLSDEVPLLFGRFRKLDDLGQGGMGEVWLCADTVLGGSNVAVKLVRDDRVSDARMVELFKKEALAARELSHENIVRVHDLHINGPVVGLSMEYLDGADLNAHLAGKVPGSPLEEPHDLMRLKAVTSLVGQIASAVDYLHDRDLVHRDIKPSNVMLSGDAANPRVKLLDFGIARAREARGQTGKMQPGTAPYMAPEVLAGKMATAAADRFAFGKVVYALLTGKPLENTADYKKVSGWYDQLDSEFDAVLAACFGATENRPQRCETIHRALVKSIEAAEEGNEGGGRSGQGDAGAPRGTDEPDETAGSGGGPRPPLTWLLVLLIAGVVVAAAVGGPRLLGERSRLGSEPEQEPPTEQVEPFTHEEPTPAPTDFLAVHGYEMKKIGPGTFHMGSPPDEEGRDEDEQQHAVQLTYSFEVGLTEVPQGLYDEVMAVEGEPESPRLAASGVSWCDAILFCNRLSERQGLRPVYDLSRAGEDVETEQCNSRAHTVEMVPGADGFRLLTEAEWEYTARAGSSTRFAHGDDEDDLRGAAWYSRNAQERVHEVGAKESPNAWGLHDVSGNVWEWVWDWYSEDPSMEYRNPTGAATVHGKVIRGGSYRNGAGSCRIANRHFTPPGNGEQSLGIRLARGALPVPREDGEEGSVLDRFGYVMVPIEPGTFWMGSKPEGGVSRDDEFYHRVETTRRFALGQTEVTQDLYYFVNSDLGEEGRCRYPIDESSELTRIDQPLLPAESVTWLAAAKFCNHLSNLEGLEPVYTINGETVTHNLDANGYRLPTEAEWEQGARAGDKYEYSGSNRVEDVAWIWSHGGETTHAVGLLEPNGNGLFDMSGNVAEWVWDFHEGDYHGAESVDPVGPEGGEERVHRGGSFYKYPEGPPGAERARVSFRLVFLHPQAANSPSSGGLNQFCKSSKSLPGSKTSLAMRAFRAA